MPATEQATCRHYGFRAAQARVLKVCAKAMHTRPRCLLARHSVLPALQPMRHLGKETALSAAGTTFALTPAFDTAHRAPGGIVQTRIVEVRQQVLKKNDTVARALRQRYADAGVFVVSIVSSPGAGKTTFLRETLCRLVRRWRVAALVGDLATENDARRLAQSGAPVKQIVTGTVCHLEAEMVESAVAAAGWELADL